MTKFKYKTRPLENEYRLADFIIGRYVFYVVTILWILFKALYLHKIFNRMFLSQPSTWMSYIQLRLQLPLALYVFACVAAICISVYYLTSGKSSTILQCILFLVILMLHSLKLTLGYVEHVDSLFILAHFFLLSLNIKYVNALYVKYFQAGLLFTYTMAGLLKVVTLINKSVNTDEMTWVEPKALFYQTFIMYDDMSLPMPGWMYAFLQNGNLCLALVLSAICMQCIAVLMVFHYKWLRYYLLVLVLFHTFNYVFFGINFIYSGLTVVCFFFPFSVFQRKLL